MSPFSQQLKMLRVSRGLRQMELAELLGSEQSYVSALELGLKGPPNEKFVNQLIGVLNLSLEYQQTLIEAVVASQRKFNIPNEAPTEIYWLIHKLRQQIDRLHPTQVELIEKVLSMPLNYTMADNSMPQRIRRRSNSIHETEAKM